MPHAAVNGVEIHYQSHGEGLPTLFIHGGFGGPASTLSPRTESILEAAPLDRVQLIMYDRRCAGASEYTIDEAFTLPDIAADARALLSHLGHDSAIIVGSSMGGMVAQQYACDYPETVAALALLQTGTNLMADMPVAPPYVETAEHVEREGAEAVFASMREELRNPPAPPARANPSPLFAEMAENRARLLEVLARLPDAELHRLWRGSVRNQAAFIGYDFASRLAEIEAIDAPKAIVHGNDDHTVPFALAQQLQDGIPSAEFHEIADADHGITAYPAAQEVIRDWLTRVA